MSLPARMPDSLLVTDFDGQVAGLLNPNTGEIASLTDAMALADWKLAMRDVTRAIAEATRIADEVILAAMDRDAAWTLNRPTGKLSAPSPAAGKETKDAWSGDKLWTICTYLVKEGIISEAARDAAVKSTVEYTAKSAGVKALLKIPDAAAHVETCRLVVEPKKRSVKAG